MEIDRESSTVDGIKIGIIPEWIRKIWLFKEIKGMIYKNTFQLNAELYGDVMSSTPSVEALGIVLHEIEHIKRSQKLGFLKYHTLYRLNPTFRYAEELACHRPQFAYYQQKGYEFDLERRAEILSGSLYLWMVRKPKALKDLRALQQEVET